jgi:succinate dehydrogenase/fumarate reductase flavoprotein subunit
MDMEMVQYHPFGFRDRATFASEGALGDGAILCDEAGQPVLSTHGLPLRDELCRSLAALTARAVLDFRALGKERISARFFYLARVANELADISLDKEPLPIQPRMHRILGGIQTDLSGATAVLGVFAAGECASPGVHGANAMAGNALTAGVIFGRRAGTAATAYAQAAPSCGIADTLLGDTERELEVVFSRPSSEDTVVKIYRELAAKMADKVGLVRDETGLQDAAQCVAALKTRYTQVGLRHRGKLYNHELLTWYELGSLLDVAQAVVVAAQARKESRGVHQRGDFPTTNDTEWRQHSLVTAGPAGPIFATSPVNTD